MPKSASPRIFRSCAADRIRRPMCSRQASFVFPSSALPITIRWPASCVPIRNLENPEVIYKPKLLIGSRLVFMDDTPDILVYPRDRAAYGRLCQLLTSGKRGDDTEKGECHLKLDDLLQFAEGQLLVLTLPHRFETAKALKILDRCSAVVRSASGSRPACCIAAMTGAVSPGCSVLPLRPAFRCWRPMKCCITIPRAGPCRTF